MDKKTIFLELPSEMVDMIDHENTTGDRSTFISNLIDSQFKTDTTTITPTDVSTELTSRMNAQTPTLGTNGELKIFNNKGNPIGTFNINTIDGFEQLANTIATISEDPVVRMKARRWR